MKWRSITAGTLVLLVAGCSSEPEMVRETRKVGLIDAIRETLLESVEAEKSAVLATSDEESKSFAREAEQSTAKIKRLRGELRALIVADGRKAEIEKLAAFDAAWADVERVDQRLLALAVANTNLKAARLSASQGAAALDRLVDGLGEIMRGTDSAGTIRTLSGASIAALRIQPLLLVHIPSADDAEMTRIEDRMRKLSEEVDHDLDTVREGGLVAPERLAAAAQAWTDYQGILKQVLHLSRENSNVISFDVSVHEKRAGDEGMPGGALGASRGRGSGAASDPVSEPQPLPSRLRPRPPPCNLHRASCWMHDDADRRGSSRPHLPAVAAGHVARLKAPCSYRHAATRWGARTTSESGARRPTARTRPLREESAPAADLRPTGTTATGPPSRRSV